jgi:hypothetical protein
MTCGICGDESTLTKDGICEDCKELGKIMPIEKTCLTKRCLNEIFVDQ